MIELVVNRLKELGSNASLSSSEKADIEDLYLEVLDKRFTRTGCSDCYHDAIIEMLCYLNRYGKMKEKCSYKLKNGVLLQPEFGSSDFYTNDNLTDEVAEKYLSKYPENKDYFSKVPENWEERVAKRTKAGKDVVINEELVGLMEEALKDGVTAQSVVEEFADYTIDGKKVTKKVLTAHVNKALEIMANMDSEGEKKTQEEEKGEQGEKGLQDENK